MKQMKIKIPSNTSDYIEVESSHIVEHDDENNKSEIIEFDLKFKGRLSEWLIEYLKNPKGSRLHKNLVATFNRWFE